MFNARKNRKRRRDIAERRKARLEATITVGKGPVELPKTPRDIWFNFMFGMVGALVAPLILFLWAYLSVGLDEWIPSSDNTKYYIDGVNSMYILGVVAGVYLFLGTIVKTLVDFNVIPKVVYNALLFILIIGFIVVAVKPELIVDNFFKRYDLDRYVESDVYRPKIERAP